MPNKEEVVSRRDLLRFFGASVAAAGGNALAAAPAVKHPRWYGFNLLEYFSTDTDWMKYFPYKNDGLFLEDDFRWMRDWGFNFARLPMDYRFWTAPDLFAISESKVEPIDRAIRLGEKYGIHVNIGLHRAPGYCILDGMDQEITGIHVIPEKTSLFEDQRTLDAFVHQWTFFARRYRGIPSELLSFNLLNEPLVHQGINEPQVRRNAEQPLRERAEYSRVAKLALAGIREHDPNRRVVTDGFPGGFAPIPELYDAGLIQSGHQYSPALLTHYNCEWVRRSRVPASPPPAPSWPVKNSNGSVTYDRQTIAKIFQPWAEAAGRVPIHFGEMGCHRYTPPEVVNAWFEDSLSVFDSLGAGWALWNFRGPFGVLDTARDGTNFEDWHGHKLDRKLLTVLQAHMKR